MSRTEEVVDGIKRMILDGVLNPGDRLPVEKELAETLGVSRGPLREGVSALSILGILNTRQGDGTYVTNLDATRLLAPMGFVVDLQGQGAAPHVHAVRRVLECEAARLAATKITDEALREARDVLDDATRILQQTTPDHERLIETDIAFHRIIAAHSGNPVLIGLIEAFAGRTVRARLWRSLHEEGADLRAHAEHLAILQALRERDPEAARIRMANHLIGVEQSLRGLPDGDDAPSGAEGEAS
ncbi:DNA-binding FadR family transcriptional regulator [Thermocatellispora tengchongensis]|uniref:DNA-binding FadR family transcriptional regulator n=1 Tax=Thermocatellispora tengchongensis TaxID=1073253 RepID=A0A840PCG2_9ACTN|nr:FadR/GntR family transcriptional regulator [Thermocatellispora tengchongensis]MBB5135531.1 DNA-binding FadR family transcriptional regulator [Thermocatellispora tengchongensis]